MSMDLESMLQSALSDPGAMEKIMDMARSLGVPSATPSPAEGPTPNSAEPEMLQKIAALAGKSAMDPNQQALLNALRPYIGPHRLQRLERAMQAAKMAGLATGLMQTL